MKQQINLYQPRLREPQRVFTARAMVRTLTAVAMGLLVVQGYAW